MEISKTLYVIDRIAWRKWLEVNHSVEPDIWLIYYSKSSGKPSIPYNDAVEEALCFGWIDTTTKKTEPESSLQRFCPRRKKSELSELNKERVKIMLSQGKMTESGIESIRHHIVTYNSRDGYIQFADFIFPEDILEELKKDAQVWKNYSEFPEYYRRIRIASIENARNRPDIFKKRLDYFLKMTAANKRFGMMP
ncbi:MAG: YdeI/OmpD-associated family protein [Bacteroidales bacterium]|nr:YdeI/OmpD-associated family protein [Bacteroidales bacterium]MCB9012882.1 YdeI/OmpD-associated family protein [Bacteroidales bacterium]